MKKIALFLSIIVFLVSCWEEEKAVEVTKNDFYVETVSGSSASQEIILKKTWKVRSWQDINLSANASGRVSSISVKAWDSVKAGQVLARLEDNIWSYQINLQRSQIWIERAQINYESTELSLDKTVFDAEQRLKDLKRNLVALESDSEQNILLAEDNLNNSSYDGLDSSASLRLQSLDNAIEKSKLDYDIKISSDAQAIEWYKANLKKEFSSLLTTLIDVQEFSDSILWVSDINEKENDDFEDFLWAQDKWQKIISKAALQTIIDFRDSQEFKDNSDIVKQQDISESEMIEIIDFIDEGYNGILDLLNNLEITLNNSIASEWSLGKTQIATYISTINWYQASAQWAYGAYISISTWIKNFLNTYEDNQLSILKSIELQEKDRDIQYKTLTSGELSAEAWYERTLISIEDNISNLESQIESAQESFENAKKNRDVTLRSLKNSIDEARVWYSSSAKEYGKLTLVSPIDGTIGAVLVDVGQEINMGTPSFEILSNSAPEIEISFSKSEKDLLGNKAQVDIFIGWEKYIWNIYAISEVADDNLNYTATVVFDADTSIIWNLVSLEIPVDTWKMLLPINILEVQGDNISLVKNYIDWKIENVRLRTGDVFGEYIEIVSCAKNCSDLNIILNDVANYDENKFNIVEK